jgi:hypothetical protein
MKSSYMFGLLADLPIRRARGYNSRGSGDADVRRLTCLRDAVNVIKLRCEKSEALSEIIVRNQCSRPKLSFFCGSGANLKGSAPCGNGWDDGTELGG